jgi:hypothetical protein
MSTSTSGNFSSNTEGQLIYNSTLHAPQFWNGSAWTQAGGVWGSISGTLSSQTDLQSALNLKAPLASPTFTGTVTAPTFSGALTGNASTATALASIPTGCSANQFADAIAASGNLTCAQVNYNQLSGVLPNPSATTLGGIESAIAVTHQWIDSISTSGVSHLSQPAFSDISGTANLTSQVTGVLPIANGGTNNGLLAVTAGTMHYGDGSKLVDMGVGTAGQVPISAGTTVAWGTPQGGLIGQREYITNTNFEVNTTGWQTYSDAAGVAPVDGIGGSPVSTFTRTTSSPITGLGSGLWTKAGSANRQGEGFSIPISIGTADVNHDLQVEFDYMVGSGTFTPGTVGISPTDSDIEIYLYDFTNAQLIPLSDKKLYVSSTTQSTHFSQIVHSSNALGYQLIFHTATTTTNNFTVLFDNISIHPYSSINVSNMTDWQTYTPTFTGLGTVVPTGMRWRRVGSNMEIEGSITIGTVTAATASISLPSGYAVDGNYTSIGGGVLGSVGLLVPDVSSGVMRTVITSAGATTLNFSVLASTFQGLHAQLGNAMFNNGENDSFVGVSVPISGWTSTSAGVRADQSNFGWTSYTPTFTGWGTVSGSNQCNYKRDGQDMLLRCKFTSGTATATEARISLPGSFVSDSSIQTLEYSGEMLRDAGAGSTFFGSYTLMEPSVGYVTFGIQTSAGAALIKQNGNGIVNSGNNVSITARIPISTWTENQSIPLLVGTVFSSTGGQERIERATITGSATTPTVASQSGAWLSTTITRAAVGNYNYTINTGMFSSAPACTCRCIDAAHSTMCQAVAATTKISLNTNCSSATSDFDVNVEIICMGPR